MIPALYQDPSYHNFADQRLMLGVPNLLNVISNLPFLMVGIWGLRLLRGKAARILFLAVAATAFGSAWYHLSPSDQTLFWDRLPMAIAFMALFSIILGRGMTLWPLVATGIASVVYWHFTGDLRLYALVQFVPMIAIPVLMILFPARYAPTSNLVLALACYAAAKIFELLDRQIELILAVQYDDGSWPRVAFYSGPRPPLPRSVWFGSEDLTSALCLEALARYSSLD